MVDALYVFTGGMFSSFVPSTNLNSAPFISLATNNTGTNIVIQITPPTNVWYNFTTVMSRPVGFNEKNNIATNSAVSGSVTISNLTNNRLYEIIAVPSSTDGFYDPIVSNALYVVPTTGSIREQILDFVDSQVRTVLVDEISDIVSYQIQIGYRSFQGKFRGLHGTVLIDGSSVRVRPYTNAARLVVYTVRVHVGWQDRRRQIRENELGQLAEDIRLKLDATQTSTVPYIIIAEVRSIPFKTREFEKGSHIRGFSLEVDFEVQEQIEC